MSRTLLLALVSTAALACSGGGASRNVVTDTLPGGIPRTISHTPVDSGQWHLVAERTIQPAEGEPGELADPGSLAIADDGTVLVADDKPTAVKVFDSAGVLLRTIGREGDGPGEFRVPEIAVRGDTLVVHDPRQRRASFFKVSDGTFISTRPSACCYFNAIQIDGSGRAVARVMNQPDSAHPAQGFVRFSLDGSRLDSVRVTQRSSSASKSWFVRENGKVIMSTAVLLSPQNVEAVDLTGGFISGWSGEYLLRATNDGSDTVSLFGRTGETPAVPAAEKQRMVSAMIKDRFAESGVSDAALRASFPAADIPDHRPFFEAISVDGSGRRWVRLSTTDTLNVHFDLFDRNGRWLDQPVLASAALARRTYQPQAWSKDRLAVVEEDATGRPLIRIYRIVHGVAP